MTESALDRTSISLLARLKRGPEDAAWRGFAERYAPLIRSWCRRWGLQDADADDVVQAVLAKLAVHLRTFEYDPSRSFRGFLHTLARHAWADIARQVAQRGSGDSAVVALLEEVPAREELWERLGEAFDLELLEAARAAVRARVEERTWEAYRLSAEEGLSGADVAGRLGLHVGAVFKARSRVQRLLREELAGLESGAEECNPVQPMTDGTPTSRTA